MPILTAADLGAFIRDRRTRLGMDQIALAKKAQYQPEVARRSGTREAWRRNRPNLVCTQKSLEISIDLVEANSVETSPQPYTKVRAPEINSVLDSLKKQI